MAQRAADSRTLTYRAALAEVCRIGNWLRAQGVQPGDSVTIYMPMVLELPLSMLACARIGAVHSVVFGGFSSASLASRMLDSKPRVLITATGVMRGRKVVRLKRLADEACSICAAQGFNVRHLEHPASMLPEPIELVACDARVVAPQRIREYVDRE